MVETNRRLKQARPGLAMLPTPHGAAGGPTDEGPNQPDEPTQPPAYGDEPDRGSQT